MPQSIIYGEKMNELDKCFEEFNEKADAFQVKLDAAIAAFKEINEQVAEIKKFLRIK